MSFFQRLGSGSDDSSDSGSESEESILSGDEGEEQDQKIAASRSKKTGASAFLRSDAESDEDEDEDKDEDEEEMDDDSEEENLRANDFLKSDSEDSTSEEEEDKTVVLSAQAKRFAEMDAAIHSIQNATKAADGAANDWVLASSELDKLLRFIARHQTAMTASPIPPAGHIPPSFLQTLVDLEQSVNDTYAAEKNATKKMSPVKTKALQALRQTLKKKVKEFELVLTSFREDSQAYTEAYEHANRAPKVPKKKAVRLTDDGVAESSDFQTIGRGGRTLNLTADGVFKTLQEIFEARGKKNTDRAETIRILVKLLEVSNTTYQKVRVLLALIPARLDYSQALPSMPFESWVSCRAELDQLLSILLSEPDYVVQETVEEYDPQVEREPEEVDGKVKRVGIAGNVVSIVENLDNEFTKTMQHADPHEKGAEYIDRLREEQPLYTTIIKAQALFERENWSDAVARTVMRRLEHIYAKPDIIVTHFENAAAPALANLSSNITPFGVQRTPSELIHLLCVFVYSSDAPLLRARAILIHIYNHAMHGRYHQARDLLLMSHLQDTVAQADVTTQILYNRAMMNLGMSAFRNGFIPESQTIFAEMFSTSRQKELLAQSIQRYGNQLTAEQELIEKRRLLPFHLHLNVELLEAAYLTSCMLLEIPQLAAAETEEQKRRSTSKIYKRLLDQADKQAFMGPPESTRDHIIKASKALLTGDWERARDLILTIKVWTLLDNAAEVKDMLARKIKEEGLRTYLFTYSTYYASLSLSHLSSTFDLPIPAVTSIISRMIYTDELAASLDQIDNVVIFHRVETTEIQRLAQQLADRAVNLVETNEKILDAKLGNTGTTETRQTEGGAGRGRTERRGGGRGRGTRGRGRGGFNTGLGEQRRIAA